MEANYNIVLVLPYINMNLPRVYTCSPSWTPFPPPSPYHPSGSSQCTSPKHPVSGIEPGLVIRFIYDICFTAILPNLPTLALSHRVQKTVLYISVSFAVSYTRIERDTCTPMFIAALFIIARTWKQPRCPSVDEWIRKLWYIYTMEYYAAIKKNTFESVLMRWMKLEPIIQSEVSQKEKHQYSILTHIYEI